MEAVLSFFTSLQYVLCSTFIGIIIFQEKIPVNKRNIALLLMFLFLIYFTIFLFHSNLSTFFVFFLLIPLYRMIFHKNQIVNTFIALMVYTLDLLLKLCLSFLETGTLYLTNFESYNLDNFILDNISFFISIILLIAIKKHIHLFHYSYLKNKYNALFLLVILFIDFGINTYYRNTNQFLQLFTTTDFIILTTAMICLIYSIEKSFQLDNVNEDYKEISSYSKLNEELNRNYRKRIHENKNQLLMIRAMIGEEESTVSNYLDCLLGDYKEQVKNYWLSDLSYLPLPGVKNFLNNKLIVLKEIGASIEIFVSNELEDICLKNLNQNQYKNFATVLGVVIDNMIDCVKEQEEKLISIHFFLENNELHGEFVNNFVEKIEIDQIFSSHYSTKGDNRGVGLSLVNKIITDNDYIDCRPKIIDNFFVQDISLKLDRLY